MDGASSPTADFFGPDILAFLSEFNTESEEHMPEISLPASASKSASSSEASVPPTTLSRSSTHLSNELQRLKDKNKNRNTTISTNTWRKRFEQWVAQKQFTIDPATISPHELDAVLQHFYADLKKLDGSDYELESLKTMLVALNRSFCEQGSTFQLLKDKEFSESRCVLNGKKSH